MAREEKSSVVTSGEKSQIERREDSEAIATLLLVDDELNVLHALSRILREHPFRVLVTSSAFSALSVLARAEVDVLLLDYWMPGMDGLQLSRLVHTAYPEVVQVMLTACAELRVVEQAMRRGEILRYLIKPWEREELIRTMFQAVEAAHARKMALAAVGSSASSSFCPGDGEEKRDWGIYAASSSDWVPRMLEISRVVEKRDPCTLGHSSRVALLSLWMSEIVAFSPTEQQNLELGALLHDVGKLFIPDAILFKPSVLESKEFSAVQQHPLAGEQMLQEQGAPAAVAAIARSHHENYDGSGYPDGRAAEEIPLGARIVRLADSFDAMYHERPYRKGLSLACIERDFQELTGRQFDPQLVPGFLKLIRAKLEQLYTGSK